MTIDDNCHRFFVPYLKPTTMATVKVTLRKSDEKKDGTFSVLYLDL